MQAGRAKGVFVTADASSKTKKEVRFFCAQANVPVQEVEVTMEDISRALGRRAGVIAVCDKGFADRLMEMLLEKPV